MKRFRSIISFIFLTVIVFGVLGCSSPPAAPSDFNLIFRYGVGARNELNTFAGTYTKDMIADPSITIPISLTDAELNRVRQKMVEIGFFEYPDVFSVTINPGEPIAAVTPYSSYYFKVESGSKVKELRWDDEIVKRNEKSEKLKELITLIRGIIEAKEEYKKLPEPTSGYL